MGALKLTACMKVVSEMSDLDRDALLDRLEGYIDDGVPKERAQVMAAADTLAELEDERRQFMRMLKEQHPEIFVVAAPAPKAQPAAANDTSEQIRKSADRTPLGFYSALARSIDGVPIKSAPAGAWQTAIKGLLNKGAVKQDELEWSGLEDWLDLQGQPKPVYESGYGLVEEHQNDAGNWTQVDDLGEYFRTQEEAGAAISDEMRQATERLAKKEGTKGRIVVKKFDGERLDFGKTMTPKISKEQVAEYLEQGGVQVEETVLPAGGGLSNPENEELRALVRRNDVRRDLSDAEMQRMEDLNAKLEAPPAKYSQYTLPGGENYREVLLTLPTARESQRAKLFAMQNRLADLRAPRRMGSETLEQYEARIAEAAALEAEIEPLRVEHMKAFADGAATEYRSGHWDQPNVLAHIRVNDRVDADGDRVLFVEELQSDWQAEARKKGLADPTARARAEKIGAEMNRLAEDREMPSNRIREEARWLELAKQRDELLRKAEGVPAAPFLDSTEKWLNLALKRVMVMAAEGGYDRVAFTTGAQNAERFSLDKSLREIAYEPAGDGKYEITATDLRGREVISEDQVGLDRIEELVGKEIAEKVSRDEGERDAGGYREWRYLRGDNLKIEAKGMRAFYDAIVPSALKKLLPKVGGGQMGQVTLTNQRKDFDLDALENATPEELEQLDSGGVSLLQPGFDVTPAMLEKVAGGLPLFSADRFVQAEDSDLYKTRTAEDVRLVSDKAAMAALKTDATSVRIMDKGYRVAEGELVGARLNLNVLKNTKVPVMTLHKATNTDGYKNNRGFYRGEAVQYQPAVTLRNAYFNVDQTGRENIATGTQNKFPMASVDGEYVDTQPNFDGVEVSFNPMRVHLFVDANGYPVRSAEEISMFGSRAYARGKIEYYTKETAPARKGEAPSEVKLSADRLIEDIPNEDWLQGKIDYAKSKGRNQFGVPFMGAITGYFKGPVDVSLRVLSKLKGERDEQNNVRDESLDYIRKNWDEVSKQPPYIEVAYNGEAWVSEGNHRIMVAAEKGLESMPVEIRYFDGGQRMSGPLAPGRIPSLEAPDIFKSADRPWFDDLSKLKVSTNYQLGDLFKSSKKLNWWNRTLGTQYNLAQKNPEFKRVFDAVQTFINDVSAYASRAADLAPTILPKLETLKDLAKSPLSAEDVKALRDPIFGGTLKYTRDDEGNIIETDDVSTAGVVFTNDELRDLFGLNDRQVGLYREFRRATNKSLSDLAVADMLRYLGKDGEGVRQRALEATNLDGALNAIVAHLDMMIEQQPERAEVLEDSKRAIKEKAGQAIGLMARGYAPLSRFGQYTVYVVGKDGEQLYFSMFEKQRDANKMAREMQEQYPEATVTTGIMSQESYKLFSGVTPETLALFGESLGLEESGIDAKSEVFQQYLKMAKTNRSAMKRLIQRKGIDGFSEDAGRVLAGFVYSNARQISTNLHAGEIGRAASEIQDGDVKDHAIRLIQYIQNPTEEAQTLKALLFNVFLGGNISSALVNLSQTATTTFPYLSQFDGTASVMKRLGDATKLAVRGIRGDDELRAALKRAEDKGIVSPQEVFHLMAQAQGKAQLQTGDGTRLGDALAKTNNFMTRATLVWGRLFSAAEQANRRIAFIAAYKLARDKNMENPFAFAEKAVLETQFSTNKGIRPAWARGAVGGVLFTFKGFTVAYLELLGRMLGNGPEGKKAFALALGTLFLFAGAAGLPFMDDLDDVIDGFAQRVLNKSFDSKQAKREFFASILGQTGADFVMGGISSLPGAPIDVSGRLGLGNIAPGTGTLTKKSNYQRDVMEIFGPAGSLFSNYATAIGMLAQGEVKAAATTAAPVGLQNVVKGMDMATMGFYRDTRGRKVIDTNGWEAVAKSMGFQPSSVKRIQDATSTQQGLIAQNKLRETEIADKMAKARIERKPELAEEAREELADWNRKNPESPIRIDAAQINRRVQQAMMDKARRIEKTAPKEIRADVKRELERAN